MLKGLNKIKLAFFSLFLAMAILFSAVPLIFASSSEDVAANEAYIFSYITDTMGLPVSAACGIMANMYRESSFQADITNTSSGAYGLCQWYKTRCDALKTYCSENGYDYKTVEGQMHYLQYELNTTYFMKLNILSYLAACTEDEQGAYDAGYYWCYYFEVPSSDASTRDTISASRGNFAKDTYWPKYCSKVLLGSMTLSLSTTNVDVGENISFTYYAENAEKYMISITDRSGNSVLEKETEETTYTYTPTSETYYRIYVTATKGSQSDVSSTKIFSAGFNDPANSIRVGSKTYYLYYKFMSWTQAEAWCIKNGGHLASIGSQTEQDAIDDLIKDSGQHFWIGASDQETEGSFVWSNGSAMSYQNWNNADGEPNDYNGGEDYCMVYSSGLWNDVPDYLNQYIGIILEKDDTDPVDSGFYGGNYYEYYETNEMWSAASLDCSSKGAHLATITSSGEQQFVHNFCDDTSSLNFVLIGGYYDTSSATWKWADGTTIDTFYWASTEPNNDGGNEYRLSIKGSNGDVSLTSWNDVSNYSVYGKGYIAEYELKDITIDSLPDTLTYYTGDNVDFSDLIVSAIYTDSIISDISSEVSISSPDMTSAGTKTITISYYGKESSFEINVKARGDLDISGSVNSADLLLLRRSLVHLITFSNGQKEAADVNNDGSVNSIDVLMLRKMIIDQEIEASQ